MPEQCSKCGGDGIEVASCAESRRCRTCNGTGQVVKTGENVGKDPVRVHHDQLERVSETSPFRSWCPVCDRGILLVARTEQMIEGQLCFSRADRCTLCGQLVVYEDDTIEGVPLHPSLDDMFGASASEGYRQGCKLCGKSLAYSGGAFCGAACCARWEAGERPKWPTALERLVSDE